MSCSSCHITTNLNICDYCFTHYCLDCNSHIAQCEYCMKTCCSLCKYNSCSSCDYDQSKLCPYYLNPYSECTSCKYHRSDRFFCPHCQEFSIWTRARWEILHFMCVNYVSKRKLKLALWPIANQVKAL